MVTAQQIIYDPRDEYDSLIDQREARLISLNRKMRGFQRSTLAWLAASAACFVLPIALASKFEPSQRLSVFNTGCSILGLLATSEARGKCRKFQAIDRTIYDEDRHLAYLKDLNLQAERGGYEMQLDKKLSELRPQKEQPQQQVVQAVPDWYEWKEEKFRLEAIFKVAGYPCTVVEKHLNGPKIEYTLRPTSGVEKDIDEDDILGASSKIARKLYWRAGLDNARIFARAAKLILEVDNPYGPKPLNIKPREAQPDNYVMVGQPTQSAPQQQYQQPISFTIQQTSASTGNRPEAIDWASENKQNQSMFPVEDVALKMAEATLNPNTARSVLAIAPPGCGKTGLLQTAIFRAHELWQGMTSFYIFAGKEDEQYCGLEKDANRYIYSGALENVKDALDRLETLNGRYAAKATGYPTIVVKDENNNTLRTCKLFDQIEVPEPGSQKTKAYPRMCGADYTALTRGRSKLYIEWLTAHGPRKDDTGQETTIFANTSGIVLGRTLDDGSPAYGAIQEALSGHSGNRVVDDPEKRDLLLAQFQQYRKRIDQGLENPKRVVCLTSVGGPWRLVLLPIYQKDCYSIMTDAEASHPGESPAMTEFDDEFEDKYGVDPDEVIGNDNEVDADPWKDGPKQPQPPTNQPQPDKPLPKLSKSDQAQLNRKNEESQKQLVQTLSAWIKELGKLPSDAELSSKVQELLGIVPSETVLDGVKKLLNQHGHSFDR